MKQIYLVKHKADNAIWSVFTTKELAQKYIRIICDDKASDLYIVKMQVDPNLSSLPLYNKYKQLLGV